MVSDAAVLTPDVPLLHEWPGLPICMCSENVYGHADHVPVMAEYASLSVVWDHLFAAR